ncbi:unnamed protein product [Enterobius vermicularis]|uniref:GON-4-like protein n=1 Tax=Enterobius vermicularis TaxID=51028 RepID=A0A0N4UVJ5_ENTVE|nr:unnamed protein product [Enterobius vermicularis]
MEGSDTDAVTKVQEKEDAFGNTSSVERNETEVKDEEEIVKLWRQVDGKLEDRAKARNRTAISVKSLLHHLIKNPDMISKVMDLDEEPDTPNLKLTRSKLKQLQCTNEVSPLLIENDTVAVPRTERTFLNIDYGQDEEDEDDDYRPEQAVESNKEEEEDETEDMYDEADIADSTEEELLNIREECEETETQRDNLMEKDDQLNIRTRSRTRNVEIECLEDDAIVSENDVLLYSAVDDPDYMTFISTLKDPELRLDFDEKDDPEYELMADELDCEVEKDELRMDRDTKIPSRHFLIQFCGFYYFPEGVGSAVAKRQEYCMREVEDLFEDLLGSHVNTSLTSYGLEIPTSNTETKTSELEVVLSADHVPKCEKLNFPKFDDHIIALIDTTPEVVEKIAVSACLIGTSKQNPPSFTEFERAQLRSQLMKHVQLLTQFVVGCQFEPELGNARDSYQEMIVRINALYDLREKSSEQSMFCIPNLDACVISCHDARSFNEEETVRLQDTPSYYRFFTVPEEHLLALGVYEFSHRAEQGKVTLVFKPETCDGAQEGPPYSWTEELLPKWLKAYQKEIAMVINRSLPGVTVNSASQKSFTHLYVQPASSRTDNSSSAQSTMEATL